LEQGNPQLAIALLDHFTKEGFIYSDARMRLLGAYPAKPPASGAPAQTTVYLATGYGGPGEVAPHSAYVVFEVHRGRRGRRGIKLDGATPDLATAVRWVNEVLLRAGHDPRRLVDFTAVEAHVEMLAV
jgi:hypothetical protein